MYKKVLLIAAFPAVLIVGFMAGHQYRYIKVPLLSGQTASLDYASLNDVYDTLNKKFDGKLDQAKLLDGAKAGLVAAAGDPYTVFLNKDAAQALSDQLSGSLSGIGAEIGLKSNKLTVISPIADTPADKAGLKAGDQILAIDGVDTTGMSVDEAVTKIRGKENTTVKLTISHVGGAPKDITITRQKINVPSVKSSMKANNIGYIQVTRFGDDTAQKVDEAATSLKSQGAKAIVLDLRNNPGGYLNAGVSVASEFLPQGKLVVEERRGGKSTDKLNAEAGGRLIGLPTVVLIDGGSASASEIVAGALHDNGVAKLVGVKSFGKGSVQDITKMGNGTQLKVTVAHWFTPNGVNINKEGIKPDTEVTITQADYDAGRDPQLQKALDMLK